MTTSDEMGAFCHDHIEHPLMWCDDKKRLIERKNAEESLRMWRRRKAEELARKEREKQEYYDMFLKHCPWGRPGGGAPNIDIRRKDITELGLHCTAPVSTSHQRLNSLQPCRFGDYFLKHKKCLDPLMVYQAHHNNPHYHHSTTHSHTVPYLKDSTHHHHHQQQLQLQQDVHEKANNLLNACNDNSHAVVVDTKCPVKHAESLKITLKDHPSLSFRDKGHLDIEVCYKPPLEGKAKPVLERVVVTDNNKCPLLDKKCDVLLNKKLDYVKKPSEKVNKPCASKDPWGKAGPGGKPWRSPKALGNQFMKSLGWTNKEMLKDLDQDNPATPVEKPPFRKSRASYKKLTQCCDVCSCNNYPAISITTNPLKPLKKPLKSLEMKEKICSRFMRQHSKQRKCDDTTTDQSAKPAADATTTTTATELNHGVELVPLLARRRACQRPISLSSTDITKHTASNDRLNTAAAELRHLNDLNVQIAQKRRSMSMARQLDRELCNRHFAAFDTFWGRPGHGAPSDITRKLKLDNLLYGYTE